MGRVFKRPNAVRLVRNFVVAQLLQVSELPQNRLLPSQESTHGDVLLQCPHSPSHSLPLTLTLTHTRTRSHSARMHTDCWHAAMSEMVLEMPQKGQ